VVKQAIKKKNFARPSIASIKEKMGLNIKNDDLTVSSANKPIEFITLPEAFVNATKLPGIPKGELSIVYGWSNTGKSTLINCVIASCQKSGILPVIFDTESHFDFKYAIDCGMEATPVYGDVEVEDVDEETGEVTGTHTETQIVNYDGDFMYFDGAILCELYGHNDYSTGKETKVKRTVPVLEDIAYAINKILDMQDEGEIQQDICFLWDSIGSVMSYKSFASKVGNNMFDAGAMQTAFNMITNNRIPLSKKVSSPYTNTMFCVNKIWLDSMSAPMAAPSIELKGGKSMYFAAHGLIIQLGGVVKASIKHLTATSKGRNYNWGTLTKIKVIKNQLSTPYNLTYEGTMICVHNGLISEDQQDAYKKNYVPKIMAELEKSETGQDVVVDSKDITFDEKEVDED
jgi:hypothetical protein